MNLFIDESKPFVYTAIPNSWSVVACYALSDDDYNRAQSILKKAKLSAGYKNLDEVKINGFTEEQYIDILRGLQYLGGTLYAVATDSSLNTPAEIEAHQTRQGDNIVEHKDKMKFEEGKQNLEKLRSRILALPQQLYVQLTCQLNLMFRVMHWTIPYYIQRDPSILTRFRWRIDRKDVTRIDFENVLEILGPMIIQSKSLSDPLMMIEGYDYSVLKRFEHTDATFPKYLNEQYGFKVKEGYNIQAMIREDIDFVDSKKVVGVQIVDLLASGLRKCLRLEFSDNKRIAFELGKLLVQARHDASPIDLVCFARAGGKPIPEVADLIRIMMRVRRPMVTF